MTTTATAEISVQNTDHPDKVVYHTKFEMVSDNTNAIRGGCEGLDGLPAMIMEIRGVTKVSAFPYMLAITRAPMFDWSDIRPRVEEILRMFANSQKQLEEAVGHGHKTSVVACSAAGKTKARPRVLPAS